MFCRAWKVVKSILTTASRALVLRKKVKQLGTFGSNKMQKEKLNTYICLIGPVSKSNDPLYYTDAMAVEATKMVNKYTEYIRDKMVDFSCCAFFSVVFVTF
ncbi:hypothetical protein Pyn_16093 [Prunus yedoensis var. nudiflora]|uniref:Uncharacterized protein n=1 Tax=Prunus yedoensis var. nudiflora TaxID=2094558 RepID=A0A315AA82_PRUYE|nr:hypothetical protein Pyn_16093 [Prunus yedoensis var. nudiflora]